MTSLLLAVCGALVAGLSGLPALLLHRRPARAQALSCWALGCGALLGLAGALGTLLGGPTAHLRALWSAPFAALALRLDPVAALFLLPVFAIPAAGAVYGLAYHPQSQHGGRAIRLQLTYGLTTFAMAVLVLSANAILFLTAWEAMALGGFFLVMAGADAPGATGGHGEAAATPSNPERPDAERAAFVYLAASHVATLAVAALFCLLAQQAGSFDFDRMASAGLAPSLGLFALALVGFGLKAGLVPFHFWLPGAHAAGPSHVSALLSGVLLKMGLYGLVRVTGWFAAPPLGWGLGLLAVGAASAVLGVAFALSQHDLKRLLAYHSVENVGIIAMGLGLALVGRTLSEPALVLLGLSGALLHVLNHALFKALLFLGAGAVQHATGELVIDRLGGLGRRMPMTAGLFLLGAVAICGLPPLNGFVSEWLVYLAALRSASLASPTAPWAVLAAPALALVGGLAAACFAKVVGVVFLGEPRTSAGQGAHEVARAMLLPMAALAAACVLIGLCPVAVLPALRRAAAAWSSLPEEALAAPARAAAASAWKLTLAALAVVALVTVLSVWRARRTLGATQAVTWGCGYGRPTARMQYTGESFASSLTGRFGWALRPHARYEAPEGYFPRRSAFDSHVPDTVLEGLILPALHAVAATAERLRRLHRPQVQAQALLVGATLIALLAWRFLLW